MKLFIWIMAAIAGYFCLFGRTDNDIVIPRKTTSERSGTGIKTHEFMALFEAKQPFSGLASGDYYTIVEVYLDSCTVCKRLEKGYAPFLDKRKDVLIHKVHFPESGINLSFNGGSEEEMRKQMEETQQLIDSYKVCGTPHIEIYGPGQNLLSETIV